ncbi:MAG: EF-P lysine aminoacylase EpmA [Pirellulales bacterium]|jgi:lysyl-tRNA synthetase class 2|nr:EF-P lysine aminoacylase EpmA [Pirellulales bacterium]
MTSDGNHLQSNDRWRPTAELPYLQLRAALLGRTRDFFSQRGFLEVETPLLSTDTVVDQYLDPFGITTLSEKQAQHLWLQTSPELAMKRILAAGSGAIYQITRAFRDGEKGPLHNREFTMVEWYRPNDKMDDGIALLAELTEALLETEPTECTSYRDAFMRHANVDPLTADTSRLARVATAANVAIPEQFGLDRDDWLDLLMLELVMPHLGRKRPVIVYDYPASQAALARIRQADPPVAERFELFYKGVELANGYHELLDADELQARAITANEKRLAMGKNLLPVENRLIEAMRSGLPPCTGVALGFDRLLMLAAGADTLADVMTFYGDRA